MKRHITLADTIRCGDLQAALAALADVITYRNEEYAKVAKRR
jgi:hypothetical protein